MAGWPTKSVKIFGDLMNRRSFLGSVIALAGTKSSVEMRAEFDMRNNLQLQFCYNCGDAVKRIAACRGLTRNSRVLRAFRAFAFALLPLAVGFLLPLSANARQARNELQPPTNERPLLQVHAKGDQIYTCKVDGAQFAWTLEAPDAQLFDKSGKAFGKHFAGPSWEANDGSKVVGEVLASQQSPKPNAIPWLLLRAKSASGHGAFSNVRYIQRLNTVGGNAPATACRQDQSGQQLRASYTADYLFYGVKS